MPRLRLTLMGLTLIALVWSARLASQSAAAQVALKLGQNPNSLGTSIGLNLADRVLVRRITEAQKALDSGDNIAAVAHLQYILNLPQDGFFRPADELAGRFISLKQQAEALLMRAAPATRQIYEQQYGPEARALFAQVVAKRDAKAAQEVMRRFLHTSAGADASYWLGAYHLDRADYSSALQCLSRLRRLPAAVGFEPQLTLRVGLCLYRTGRAEKAQALVREVAVTSKVPVLIGGQTLAPGSSETQIAMWLKAVAPLPQKLAAEPTGWMMQRGNAERNLLLHSSPPVGKSLWKVALSSWQPAGEEDPESTINLAPQVSGLNQIHADKGVVPLPAAVPLLVNNIIVSRFYDHLSGFDARTGQEVWRSAENDRIFQLLYKNLQSPEKIGNAFNNRLRSPRDYLALLIRQRTWEDLTFGGLSSDGDYVFSIEDLGLLNDLSVQVQMGGTAPTNPLLMREYNRLCAYEVRTGKLKWEVGGPRGDVSLNLPGTFFLGPPLPVDRQLYCIVESQAQTLLLSLDPRTGKQLWSQTLSQPADDLIREPNRRRAGTSPALMGDLLICPTGSGLVVAVDVAARSLAWAYQYAAPASTDPRDPRVIRRRMAAMGIPQVEMDPLRGAEINEWQDGTPIVAEGHVILTPRDSSELHCLSLDEGKTVWRLPRKDGLYVAAVQSGLVIVVAARSVEAIRLTDGKPAWPQPVALMNQSGRGIVTEKQILLPLITNEVATIDLKTGRPLSRVRIHDRLGLGNLIPGPGIIVSQTAENLSVFRTFDAVSEETQLRLAQNPEDPEALAQRGEFRLSQGEFVAGQADLRLSLMLRKSPETQAILFESLLQTLQTDFPAQRPLLSEIEQLAQTPAQFSVLYRTWAEGLLAAGELAPAFDILLKLSQPGVGPAELERLDGHRSLRRDRWVRTQLQELVAKVDLATQQRVQTALQQRLDQAKSDQGVEPLRHFLQFFGSHPLADEARQELVDRLLATEYSIEVEQLLAQLRHSPQPQVAGRALATLIRELVKLGRAEDCDQLLSELVQNYAGMVCLNDKTGQQLADSWKPQVAGRVRFSRDWPTGKIETDRKSLVPKNMSWMFDVFIDGDRGPFFKHSQFKSMQDALRIVGLNGWGEPSWSVPIGELGPNINVNACRAQVRNHLVFLSTGLQVIVLNALTEGTVIRARTMWSSPLVEGPLSEQNQVFQMVINRPGVVRPRGGIDRWQNPIGMAGAIDDESVAILRGRHLILADLLTGQPLWKRTDMPGGSEIFGDRNSILVVPPEGQEVLQIRRTDGATMGTHPLPQTGNRLLTFEHSVLSVSKSLQKDALTFQLTDIPARKVTWERSFDQLSQYIVFSETELAVLEPSGMLSLVSIADGRVLWQQQLQLFANFKELWVVPDGDRLLVIHGEMPPRNNLPQAMMPVSNNQTLIDGQADYVNRSTGQILWSQRIERFALDYSLPQYLPFWIFTVRTQTVQPQNVIKIEFQMQIIDKRSGRVLLRATEASHVGNIQVQMDENQKQVSITLNGGPQPAIHTLKYTDQAVEPSPDPTKLK